MKMRTKKCGIYAALAAVLLVSAVLVTNCVDPLGPGDFLAPPGKEQARFIPPPGMGYIQLNVEFEKSPALTTMPTTTGYTAIGQFSKREVYITGGDGGTTYNNLTWTVGTPIPVNTNATPYTVTIVGYNGETPAVAVAAGSGNVQITGTTGNTVTITMKEIMATSGNVVAGNGTLNLALGNAFGVDSAKVVLTGLSSGAGNVASTDVIGGATQTTQFDLAPGYYRMDLTLTKAKHATVIIREVIVIWSGLPTTYTRTLSLNSNVHEIEYFYNDERTPDAGDPPDYPESVTKEFNHGATFTHPTEGAPTQYLDSDNAVVPNKSFVGWFTVASETGGTEWVTTAAAPATVPTVLRPITLYARWLTSGSTGNITITVDVGYGSGNAVTINVTYAAGGNFNTGTPITLTSMPELTFTVGTITPALPAGTTTYAWTYQDGTSLSATNSSTVDLASDAKYSTVGEHEFTVLIHDSEGRDHSAHVVITVAD